MTEEQIKKLLEWYVELSETRKKYLEYRKKISGENHKWIQPEIIQQMSNEQLKEKFLEYYKAGGGRQNLNQIYRDRIIRDENKFRETILYLLNEEIDIKKRIDEILDSKGKYHNKGFGKAIATSFLMDYDPNKYCLWNNKTEMGFSVLGWKLYENKDSWGDAYQKVLDALKKLKNLKPEYNLTFEDIDLFLHTISAENEGIYAVEAVREGRDPPRPGTGHMTQISPEAETMEFSMEKHLEDFIEANFNKINFGAKLELYQDEENTGRQYPTPIGNIDLLAIDKERKEFIVIELKKNVSSDTVIGQILRYMGWVKENLAKDKAYNVRGIIIVKERDEKLEYALKMVQNVSLFIYNVSFDVKQVI